MMTMRELARRWVVDHDEAAFAEYCQREAARLDGEEAMTDPQTTPPLPERISEAIADYGDAMYAGSLSEAEAADIRLRHAIGTALVQAREDTALRERAERLRVALIHEGTETAVAAALLLEPGDLADDLVPPEP